MGNFAAPERKKARAVGLLAASTALAELGLMRRIEMVDGFLNTPVTWGQAEYVKDNLAEKGYAVSMEDLMPSRDLLLDMRSEVTGNLGKLRRETYPLFNYSAYRQTMEAISECDIFKEIKDDSLMVDFGRMAFFISEYMRRNVDEGQMVSQFGISGPDGYPEEGTGIWGKWMFLRILVPAGLYYNDLAESDFTEMGLVLDRLLEEETLSHSLVVLMGRERVERLKRDKRFRGEAALSLVKIAGPYIDPVNFVDNKLLEELGIDTTDDFFGDKGGGDGKMDFSWAMDDDDDDF